MTHPPLGEPTAGTPAPEPSAVDDEALLAAFVGPHWESHYRAAFAALAGGAGLRTRFNTAAAFAPLWLAWRGFWLLQFGACLAFVVALIVLAIFDAVNTGETLGILFMLAVPYFLLGAIEGLWGNRLVYDRARRRLAKVRRRELGGDEALAAMRKAGRGSIVGVVLVPTATVLGVNLLELAGHSHDHDRSYMAAMKSDLRNLVAAEESYFADSVTYTNDTLALGFRSSTYVTVYIGSVTGTGWNATAKNSRTEHICGIWVGSAAPPIAGEPEGEPRCEVPAHH